VLLGKALYGKSAGLVRAARACCGKVGRADLIRHWSARGFRPAALLGRPRSRPPAVAEALAFEPLQLAFVAAPEGTLAVPSHVPTHAQTAARRGVLNRLCRWALVRTDSPVEGTGFEPSVPRGKGPTLRVSVLFRSDFSVGGEPTRGDFERLVVSRGTDGSNPVPSCKESTAKPDADDSAQPAEVADPANPRRHSKKQIRQIAESIRIFGFNVPILIDREGKAIAGHGRLLACRELGVAEVPTLCLDHLTPAQARAFMIADNRLTEIATWDDQLLAQQLKGLSLLGLDFSLEVTGFEMGEIDLRIASLEETSAQGDDPADVLPESPAGVPVSKIGDLWFLGRHRLLCGSALDTGAFTALMGQEHAATVFTDPPYNVEVDGHASGLGAIHHRPFPMASGEMNKTEFIDFLGQALRNLAAFSAAGSLHYICMDWRHLEELLTAGAEAYGELKNL
jgi:ParB-like nuclease family protein